jgi:hypothetical protein
MTGGNCTAVLTSDKPRISDMSGPREQSTTDPTHDCSTAPLWCPPPICSVSRYTIYTR